jgi:hypothetical protein
VRESEIKKLKNKKSEKEIEREAELKKKCMEEREGDRGRTRLKK